MHLAATTGRTTDALRQRLPRLQAAGLVRGRQPFAQLGKVWMITADGLQVIGSDLSVPRLSYTTLVHTLAVAEVGIQREADPSVEAVVSERQVASLEPRTEPLPEQSLHSPFRGGRHRPDIVTFVHHERGLIQHAIEVELTAKPYKEYVAILESGLLGVHNTIEYLCADVRIARRVRRAADHLGAGERVVVTPYIPALVQLPSI